MHKEPGTFHASQVFTRVDYRKAVNKENLSRPKLAKPLCFLLQVLYRCMRRVASWFPLVQISRTKL